MKKVERTRFRSLAVWYFQSTSATCLFLNSPRKYTKREEKKREKKGVTVCVSVLLTVKSDENKRRGRHRLKGKSPLNYRGTNTPHLHL